MLPNGIPSEKSSVPVPAIAWRLGKQVGDDNRAARARPADGRRGRARDGCLSDALSGQFQVADEEDIDGADVAIATADARGRAEVELDVPMP